jgi:hypothetical protein
MPKIIAPFPAIGSLKRDAKIVTGETGILTRGIIVIKSFEPLPGLFR